MVSQDTTNVTCVANTLTFKGHINSPLPFVSHRRNACSDVIGDLPTYHVHCQFEHLTSSLVWCNRSIQWVHWRN